MDALHSIKSVSMQETKRVHLLQPVAAVHAQEARVETLGAVDARIDSVPETKVKAGVIPRGEVNGIFKPIALPTTFETARLDLLGIHGLLLRRNKRFCQYSRPSDSTGTKDNIKMSSESKGDAKRAVMQTNHSDKTEAKDDSESKGDAKRAVVQDRHTTCATAESKAPSTTAIPVVWTCLVDGTPVEPMQVDQALPKLQQNAGRAAPSSVEEAERMTFEQASKEFAQLSVDQRLDATEFMFRVVMEREFYEAHLRTGAKFSGSPFTDLKAVDEYLANVKTELLALKLESLYDLCSEIVPTPRISDLVKCGRALQWWKAAGFAHDAQLAFDGAMTLLLACFNDAEFRGMNPSARQWARFLRMTHLDSSKGFRLENLLFLSLSLGDPWTFKAQFEPHPGHVIDLAWEHIWKHEYLGERFRETALWSRRQRLVHLLEREARSVLSFSIGRVEMRENDSRILVCGTVRLNIVLSVCPLRRAPDMHMYLVGVEEAKDPLQETKSPVAPLTCWIRPGEVVY